MHRRELLMLVAGSGSASLLPVSAAATNPHASDEPINTTDGPETIEVTVELY